MKKHIYPLILLITIFCHKSFSQAYPPVINSYTDTVGSVWLVLYLNYTANDTGIIKAQVQLAQGAGNNVYDSTYAFRAPVGDSGIVQLNVGPLTNCNTYDLLVNMSNDLAQSPVTDPLFTFTTLCTNGIALINENNYSLIAFGQNIQVKATELPENGAIEIYDLTGRLILTTTFNQSIQQIAFNKNAGIYLLRITGNGQSLYTNRFVIY